MIFYVLGIVFFVLAMMVSTKSAAVACMAMGTLMGVLGFLDLMKRTRKPAGPACDHFFVAEPDRPDHRICRKCGGFA